MEPTAQCPDCGSANVVQEESISGTRVWRCRECGNVWEHEPRGLEQGTPSAI